MFRITILPLWVSVTLSVFGAAVVAFGQEVVSVTPYTPPSFNDAPTETPIVSFSRELTLNLELKCFAPNLRQTPMPAAPDADIMIEIGIRSKSNPDAVTIVKVNDPASAVDPATVDRLAGWHFKPFYWASDALTDPAVKKQQRKLSLDVSAPSNGVSGRASLSKNLLKVVIAGAYVPAADANGAVDQANLNEFGVDFIRVSQTAAPNSAYAGSDGPVNANIRYLSANNGKKVVGTIDVPAAASPGQIANYLGGQRYTDFCGGWYSPLMLFFDEQRPAFTGVSSFPIAGGSPVYWPEKNAPGYFLALDKNKDGKISEEKELFGPVENGDGFVNLKLFDSNNDGKINRDDPIFSKLLLWRDANSDGRSQKAELFALKTKKVVEIQLKSENIIRTFGGRAESKAEADFTFRAGQELKKGRVLDVYFTRHLNIASASKD